MIMQDAGRTENLPGADRHLVMAALPLLRARRQVFSATRASLRTRPSLSQSRHSA